MSEHRNMSVEEMKKQIHKVRTQKISGLTLSIIIIIVVAVIGVGTYVHLQWRKKNIGEISSFGAERDTQVQQLAKPASWTLKTENVEFIEDKDVAKQGGTQYQVTIDGAAKGSIVVKGYYDTEAKKWYDDGIDVSVSADSNPSSDDISHLFAAILAVYFGADGNEAYEAISSSLSKGDATEGIGANLVLGRSGNIHASVGFSVYDGNIWYMNAGTYN